MNARASARFAPIRTMEEFSVASGISRPTLSRFFNDSGRVRPTTRQKIEAAMDRLGYRPNLFAINFNRRNTKTVGIIVPTLLDPFYAALVQRIEFQALEAGYWSVIQSSQGDPDREADGAFVGTNNDVSMNLMVDYLLRSGAPPSYFDMPAVNQNATERRRAYELSMLERAAPPGIFYVPSLDWDFERLAFQEATRLFKTDAPFGGTILCANDRVAFGVMVAACQIGISVGRLADIRIAGHDDHPLSQYACPSLTTVAQDVDRLATLSLERLMQGISDGGNKNSADRLEARLIMRNSA